MSWFTCGFPPYEGGLILTLLDGVSGWFWIHMNRGKLFSTKSKGFLTVVNAGIMCLGAAIVCSLLESWESYGSNGW